MEEPAISGKHSTISRTENGYSGRLVNTTLLPKPENLVISKVGGPGKEFVANGVNYEQYVNRANSSEEAGAWRLEVSPRKPAQTDLFLNVLQVMDHHRPLAVKMIETPAMTGVTIADRLVLFSKSGDKLKGKLSIHLNSGGSKKVKVLVTDLHAGKWLLKKAGSNYQASHEVEAASGTLYFEGISGNYTLEHF
jgi:hypothetical protein